MSPREPVAPRLAFAGAVAATLAILTAAASSAVPGVAAPGEVLPPPAPAAAVDVAPAPPPSPSAAETPAAATTGAPARATTRAPVRLTVNAPPGAEPVRLKVPSVGLSLPVTPVSVDTDGQLGIPEDVERIGWWAGGARPGSGSGPVVLAAHRDSKEDGRGPFADVEQLRRGDTATVTLEDGSQRVYRVVEREVYRKTDLAGLGLFDRAGAERLLLITCGGSYRSGAGGWDSNVVVTLRPA